MLVTTVLALLPNALALCAAPLPRLPTSADEMMRRAAAAVSRGVAAGALRQTVRLVVPDDQRTFKVFGAIEIEGTSAPEDLDPWPGGLQQQYPIALDLARRLLSSVTGAAAEGGVTDQVLDDVDACGLVLAQGATPAEDASCVLFPGTDQMDELQKVDKMTGSGRLLCLLNPQFRRVEDFSLWQRGKAKDAFFERGYELGYAFEEFACRGEDLKLVGEYGVGWRVWVVLDDARPDVATPLHEGALPERPEYKWLEQQINERHPKPRWARKLGEVEEQGLRFMRKDGES